LITLRKGAPIKFAQLKTFRRTPYTTFATLLMVNAMKTAFLNKYQYMKKVILSTIMVAVVCFARAAAPTVQASAINLTTVGCNAVTISWTNGNGANRIAAVYPGAITAPAGAYVANQIYSSGAAIGGGRVVYNGTGNSVIVVGLNVNTTYTIVVYEYNAGPVYLTTTTNSVTVTTESTCGNCPTMTGSIINGCNSDNTSASPCPGGCGEGDTEMIYFNTGSYGFVTKNSTNSGATNNGSIPFMNYFSGGSSSIANAVAYSTNAALTTTLNSMTGCAGVFIDASAGAVPPWSTVLIVRNTFCPNSYTLTSVCSAFSPIYVLYADPSVSSWAGQNQTACATGNFANGAGANRYFNLDFSQISVVEGGASSAGCNYYYSYNWGSSNDGDGIYFTGSSAGTTSATATAASGKSTGACNLPIVLPVNIISLSAVKIKNNTIEVKWITASETDNNYFAVEYSLDGQNFTNYKNVKGAGNSNQTKTYSSIFSLDIGNVQPYFRIKQVDFNGNYKYSEVFTVKGNSLSSYKTYYNTEAKKIVLQFGLQFPQPVNIRLFDVNGNKIYDDTPQLDKGNNELFIDAPATDGIYFVVLGTDDIMPVHQKIAVYK
jgi:hypothetical protein